jgi:hypothetical protein
VARPVGVPSGDGVTGDRLPAAAVQDVQGEDFDGNRRHGAHCGNIKTGSASVLCSEVRGVRLYARIFQGIMLLTCQFKRF